MMTTGESWILILEILAVFAVALYIATRPVDADAVMRRRERMKRRAIRRWYRVLQVIGGIRHAK